MPIRHLKLTAIFEGVCTIEEAEELKTWIGDRRHVLVDLSDAGHVHTAIVQVILASNAVRITAMPQGNPLLFTILAPSRVAEEQPDGLTGLTGREAA